MTGKSDSSSWAEFLAGEYGFELFPIQRGQKFPPLVKEWQTAATRDIDTLREWKAKFPGCNWGIHTRGLIAVDMDVKKDGVTNAKTLGLPPTLIVRTPSGGYHALYAHESGVRNGVDVLGRGIDIRSTGGYVVAPGSRTANGVYKIVRDLVPAPAPDWLVQRCQLGKVDKSDIRDIPDDVDADRAIERAKAFLDERAPAVEFEGGDHWTFTTIARLRDLGVPRDRVAETLASWNATCSPPWSADELDQKITNVFRYAENPAGGKGMKGFTDLEAGKPDYDEGVVYSPADITLESIQKCDYLVKGLLPQSSNALLFGKYSAGKTFCALSLASHIAAGEDWFGRKVKQAGVLYFNWEGSAALGRRLIALQVCYPGMLTRQTPLLIADMDYAIVTRERNKARGTDKFNEAIRAFGGKTGKRPGLIVIDTLRHALGGGESDTDLTSAYSELVKEITGLGVTVLTIHHPGHSDPTRSRGDSGIEAGCDTVIRVDRELQTLETIKQRDGKSVTLGYALDEVELGVDEEGERLSSCVARYLEPGDHELTELEKAFMEWATRQGEGRLVAKNFNAALDGFTLNKMLDSLVDKGELVRKGKDFHVSQAGFEDLC